MALGKLRDPATFWKKLGALAALEKPIPPSAERALRPCCPYPFRTVALFTASPVSAVLDVIGSSHLRAGRMPT